MIMEEILKSASKLVFILLTVTACVGFLSRLLPVDQFMILCMAAATFYFSNKGDSSNDYLGK
jgi:hypothetical protein